MGADLMARQRSPNRDRAYEIYIEHNGKISSQEIAEILNEKINNINSWRVQDKWSKKLNKVGAPYGNKNALGNVGGAPPENQNARTYGWYSKYYPTTSRNLIKEAEEAGGTPLEILWAQIMTQWIAIIRAQKIMYVKNQKDMTKELKKTKVQKENVGSKSEPIMEDVYIEEEYELQFAWDKHATFLNAQSRAMAQLTNMLKKYDEMLHANWDTATEEQKLRVEKIKLQLDNPEFKHKKEISEKKLELENERFKHQKDIDSKKYW